MLLMIKETEKTTHPASQTQADAPSSILERADAPLSIIVLPFVKSFWDIDMPLIIKETIHPTFQTQADVLSSL